MGLVDVLTPPGKPNGLSFARMMHYRHPRTPTIFINAYEDAAELVANLPAKAFAKSIDVDLLVAAIKLELAGQAA
jgi:DNA-binding NarL/FixJ family response regulator